MSEMPESATNEKHDPEKPLNSGSRISAQFELEPLQSPAELEVHAEELYDVMSLDPSSGTKKTEGLSKKSSKMNPSSLNLKKQDDTFINWLSAMGLDKYHEVFVNNDISFDMLGDLKKDDMKVLVPRVGDRIRIWKAITGLLATPPTSENNGTHSTSGNNYPNGSNINSSSNSKSTGYGSTTSVSSMNTANHNNNNGAIKPTRTLSSESAKVPLSSTSERSSKHSRGEKPAPDPRFKRVTFHTVEKKSLHVELLPTTQILSYVRHCAKMNTDRPIKVNDGFDQYVTDDAVRSAIFDYNIREFWIEPPTDLHGSSSTSNFGNKSSSSRNRSKSSSTVSSARRTKPNTPTRERFDSEVSLTAPLPPVPKQRSNSTKSTESVNHGSRSTSSASSSSSKNPNVARNRLSTRTIVNPVDRPTSLEVSKRLSEYFPNIDQKQLEEGIRNSKIISSRFSTINGSWRSSFRYSKRFSSVSTISGARQSVLKDTSSLNALLNESDTDYELLEKLDSEEMTPSVWLRGQLVGNGSFGSVYLAFNMATGEIIAVKQVQLSEKDDKEKNKMVESLRREVSFLRELDHENIVQYRGFKREGDKINIFLEYISGGSLASRIARKGPIPEESTRIYIKQCLAGLSYLHDKGIIHRDIKGANILVDSDYKVKISDFGLSKYEQPGAQRFSMQGTAFWMAPEVARARDSTTTKADIWSLGCLIIEMVTGDHPFPKLQAFQAIYKIGSGSTPEIPPICSPKLKNFLEHCLKTDPKQRATAQELLQHPFITEK